MTFNIWTFLLEAINFLVLAYVLHRVLYRPLRDAIDRRREAHERAQAEAEAARDEARLEQQELQRQLADLDRQRQETLHQAHEQAAAERRKLLDDAERTSQQRQEAARTALARERDETLKALQTEIVDQAVDLARGLLAEAADCALNAQLARRLIERLRQLPESDRETLRRNWRPQDMAVLEATSDLDEGSAIQHVSDAVAATLGQPTRLTVQRRESLIGGVRLRLGGQVWDASIEGQLNGIGHSREPGAEDG